MTLVGIAFFIEWNNYEYVASFLFSYLPQSTIILEIFKSRFFTLQRLEFFRLFIIVLVFLNSVATLLSFIFKKRVRTVLEELSNEVFLYSKSVRFFFFTMGKAEKISLFASYILLLILLIVAIIKFPLHIDEAFSYVFLVERGFGTTLTFYPGPNNHIAYLLLSSIAGTVLNSPLWIMRLPALIISLSLFTELFLFIRGNANWKIALSGSWLFFTTPYGLFYATHGRGYILTTLLALLLLKVGLRWAKRNRKLDCILLIVISSLGVFTVPTFIFPLISFYCILFFWLAFKKGRSRLISLCIMAFFTILGTLLLYSPIVLFNGIEAVYANPWVAPISLSNWVKDFPQYFLDWIQFPYGEELLGATLVIVLLLGGILLLFKKSKTDSFLLKVVAILSMILTPFLLIMILRVYPPIRTWVYQISFLSILLSIITFKLNSRKRYSFFLVFLIAYSISFFSTYKMFLEWTDTKNIYCQVDRAVEFVYKKDINEIFVGKDIYNVFIRLKYLEMNEQIKIETDNSQLSTKYNFIILPNTQKLPLGFTHQLIYEDDYINIFHNP